MLVEAVKQLDAKQAETTQLQQQLTALQAQVALLQAAVQKVTGKAVGTSGSTNFDASQFSLGQNVPNPSPGASRIDYSATSAGRAEQSLRFMTYKARR
ncbi:MAG: hypothetical protein WKG07_43270 [Hymenobacter sp.]